jgi:hypothetical protein
MRVSTRIFLSTALVAALAGATARPAHGDIVVVSGVNNQGTDNVLLTDATDVATVIGTVNSGLFDVKFVSSGGNLNADASGQAVVTAADANDPFKNISFFVEDATFTRAVFNLNSATNGDVQFRVTGVNIDGGLFENTYSVVANGQNFFTVTAINGQLMSVIELTAQGMVEFEDLRQVRIGGVTANGGDPIPEPTSMLLLGSGLAAVAAVRRRR